MDAGLAAVLGALAGAVATTGAAFATGWATREQARIAARAEHKRQRREPREKVYKAFLAEATALRNLLQVMGYFRSLPEAVRRAELNPEITAQAEEIEAQLKQHFVEVTLAGPESVQESAVAIEYASRGLVGMAGVLTRMRWEAEEERAHWEHAWSYMEALDRAFSDFSKQAQAVLDDDGTKQSTKDAYAHHQSRVLYTQYPSRSSR
jgi:hypothetical protein